MSETHLLTQIDPDAARELVLKRIELERAGEAQGERITSRGDVLWPLFKSGHLRLGDFIPCRCRVDQCRRSLRVACGS